MQSYHCQNCAQRLAAPAGSIAPAGIAAGSVENGGVAAGAAAGAGAGVVLGVACERRHGWASDQQQTRAALDQAHARCRRQYLTGGATWREAGKKLPAVLPGSCLPKGPPPAGRQQGRAPPPRMGLLPTAAAHVAKWTWACSVIPGAEKSVAFPVRCQCLWSRLAVQGLLQGAHGGERRAQMLTQAAQAPAMYRAASGTPLGAASTSQKQVQRCS